MNRKDASRNLKRRDFSFQLKAVADDGKFEGYGSVFGNVDSYKEIVAEGAFLESLAAIKSEDRVLPALWQHNSNEPVGGYDVLAEDDHGLKVSGFLLTNDVARAREAHALMKARVVTGLSIGYYVRESSYDEKTGIRTLSKLDLVEVSIVTFPANEAARVDAVKNALDCGKLPTEREMENFLRESGFSKARAQAFIAKGFAGLRRDSGDSGVNDVSEALRILNS